MAEPRTASEQITEEVTSWPGVSTERGERGELAFKFGRREIGHLHGDRAAHFGFPRAIWGDLYEQKRIDYHPVFPDKQGPAARRIDTGADVVDVIALLRLNYDRILSLLVVRPAAVRAATVGQALATASDDAARAALSAELEGLRRQGAGVTKAVTLLLVLGVAGMAVARYVR